MDKPDWKYEIMKLEDEFGKFKFDKSFTLNKEELDKRFQNIALALKNLAGNFGNLEKLSGKSDIVKGEFDTITKTMKDQIKLIDEEKDELKTLVKKSEDELNKLKLQVEGNSSYISRNMQIDTNIIQQNQDKLKGLSLKINKINQAIIQLDRLTGLQQQIGALEQRLTKLENHNHNDKYSLLNHNHDGKYSDKNHNHDGEYAKTTYVDDLFGKANETVNKIDKQFKQEKSDTDKKIQEIEKDIRNKVNMESLDDNINDLLNGEKDKGKLLKAQMEKYAKKADVEKNKMETEKQINRNNQLLLNFEDEKKVLDNKIDKVGKNLQENYVSNNAFTVDTNILKNNNNVLRETVSRINYRIDDIDNNVDNTKKILNELKTKSEENMQTLKSNINESENNTNSKIAKMKTNFDQKNSENNNKIQSLIGATDKYKEESVSKNEYNDNNRKINKDIHDNLLLLTDINSNIKDMENVNEKMRFDIWSKNDDVNRKVDELKTKSEGKMESLDGDIKRLENENKNTKDTVGKINETTKEILTNYNDGIKKLINEKIEDSKTKLNKSIENATSREKLDENITALLKGEKLDAKFTKYMTGNEINSKIENISQQMNQKADNDKTNSQFDRMNQEWKATNKLIDDKFEKLPNEYAKKSVVTDIVGKYVANKSEIDKVKKTLDEAVVKKITLDEDISELIARADSGIQKKFNEYASKNDVATIIENEKKYSKNTYATPEDITKKFSQLETNFGNDFKESESQIANKFNKINESNNELEKFVTTKYGELTSKTDTNKENLENTNKELKEKFEFLQKQLKEINEDIKAHVTEYTRNHNELKTAINTNASIVENMQQHLGRDIPYLYNETDRNTNAINENKQNTNAINAQLFSLTNNINNDISQNKKSIDNHSTQIQQNADSISQTRVKLDNDIQNLANEDKKLSEEMKKYVLQSEYDDDKELLTKQFKEEIIPDMTRKLMSHDGMIATTAELVNKHETNLREENKMLKDKISQMETKITETYNYMQSKGMDFADLESEVERQRRLLLILAGDHVRKQFVREY